MIIFNKGLFLGKIKNSKIKTISDSKGSYKKTNIGVYVPSGNIEKQIK